MAKAVKTATEAKKATFKLVAPYASSVSVAGDFNNWDTQANPLKKDWNGDWTAALSLKAGSYQYKFYVDGAWQNDPDCKDSAPNQFGGSNSLINVK